VQFTVLDPPGESGIIAHVEVHAVPVRGGASIGEVPVVQTCPVFYRPYRNEPELVEIPVCNINNLTNLLAKYRRTSAPQTLGTNFEKKGSWYRGPMWRDGPAVDLPNAIGVEYPPSTFAGSASPSKLLVPSGTLKKQTMKKSGGGLPPVGSPKPVARSIELPGVSRGLTRTYKIEELDSAM